eukprot:9497611-Pyramimonas_sp.AAC.1
MILVGGGGSNELQGCLHHPFGLTYLRRRAGVQREAARLHGREGQQGALRRLARGSPRFKQMVFGERGGGPSGPTTHDRCFSSSNPKSLLT